VLGVKIQSTARAQEVEADCERGLFAACRSALDSAFDE
jgi:hypothetical protein